jgi:glycosyltransferase involved in cell wall biosynthesis
MNTTRLLLITQVVDLDDTSLSFFHKWIEKLAEKFDRIEVICLKEGRHALPGNVSVHSLGKESTQGNTTAFSKFVGRVRYISRFLSLAWSLRYSYDAVFVHMNQEYVMLAGWLWKLLRKRVFLWRNYHTGDWGTDFAALWCSTVFCTSRYSYTAKYKKTRFMPVGIDTERFFFEGKSHVPQSILFFARMAPSKRPEVVVDALRVLEERGVRVAGSFVGSPLPEDQVFYEGIKNRVKEAGLQERVGFVQGVSHEKAPSIFWRHEIYVNAAPSGMYDKMIFEAAACGTLVLASSKDFAREVDPRLIFEEGNSVDLAERIMALILMEEKEKKALLKSLGELAERQSLTALAGKLAEAIH